jgi:cell division protein ZapA
MSNVVLSIGGRSFSVACADGEERHIETLGNVIDQKVQALGTSAGQNEVRMLLYAALVLADELHEASSASLAEVSMAPPESHDISPALSARLEHIAGSLENLALHLERGASTP